MKKIDELKQLKASLVEEIRSLNADVSKVEEAEAKMEELRKINKQIDVQSELDKSEENEVGTKMENRDIQKSETELRSVFYKAVAGKNMTQEERALVQSLVNEDGGYLVPQDIKTQINELKRQYKSAKMLIDVVPVGTESGSFVVEDTSTMTGLVNFDDDNTGLAEAQPKFRNVEYKVDNYGVITPVAKSFLQDETANFMSYLSKHFARKAILTENTQIFAELKRGKTPTSISEINDIKKIVNVDLDPAIKAMSVVIVNQTGFNRLDKMEDLNGRPMLQPDPSDSTKMLLLGLPVHVFSNKELAGDTIIIGAISEGVKFFDRGVYEVAVSAEAGFTKNQMVARVVERFDVKQADADAYVVANLIDPA